MRRSIRPLILWLLCSLAAATGAQERPKVRAVTAFVQIDRAQYKEQVTEALRVLRRARQAYEVAGYQVQTLRITSQPFPEYTAGLSDDEILEFFKAYDELARREGFIAAIGPASDGRENLARLVPLLARILGETDNLDASLIVADESGVDWRAVRGAAQLVAQLSEATPKSQGNFRFSATAMVPPFTPFYPGSYHSSGGRSFAVALESANVVAAAMKHARVVKGARAAVAEQVSVHARVIEAVALRLAEETGWDYRGIDVSPAPSGDVSIGAAIESFTGRPIGSSGTLTAAALITDAIRSIPVKQTGYSGLMLPVLEDAVLAKRWSEGMLTLDELLAYSAVCGTGLDTIPLPGDITIEQLEKIIGDVAALAVKLRKPLSARLMPVAAKRAGDRTEFDDPFIVNTVLQPLP